MSNKNLEKIVFFDGDGVVWNFDTDYGSSWTIARDLLNEEEKKIWDYKRERFHSNFENKNHEEYVKYIENQFELIRGKEIKNEIDIPYTSGFQEFSKYLKSKNYYRILLSGGFWPVLLKTKHYFDELIGNVIVFNENKLEEIKVIVTPFNKQEIIKSYTNAKKVLIFVDFYEYGIFKDNKIINDEKYELYLINPENKQHTFDFIDGEFKNFEQALNYFKNETRF